MSTGLNQQDNGISLSDAVGMCKVNAAAAVDSDLIFVLS